ncbi:uncharacterized protein L969DRAFT_84666 [Mixia osmundae IAM 14324]|uniref:Bud22 domain-containing protein n=1 Tax=Mixia osmundae (strain CBS 9802 / IAM 14324 / JCM 22182 / KY 12970) TaxID=764103 RepID=G7DTP0_MIXOS|nr:uncharacterized protein L969DRAFT_84666 [Mixia osmundae IAM 14324]KEI42779.1 hypothetical protein L969DRAFT_84666 [Mixia osmundae IAM 14324]GAA93887.1 hypothetical protein E5Q_00533 [Mixia osmundae IAM 14324]
MGRARDVKRLRTQAPADPGAPPRLSAKLVHLEATELVRASKRAAKLEHVKVLRKLKEARAQGDNANEQAIAELEELARCIKAIDHTRIANFGLERMLRSDVELIAHPTVLAHIKTKTSKEDKMDPTTPQGKAQGRVLATKTVQQAIKDARKKLRSQADLAPLPGDSEPPKKRAAPAPSEPASIYKKRKLSASPQIATATGAATPSEAERSDERSMSEAVEDDTGFESESDIESSVKLPSAKPGKAKQIRSSAFLPSLSAGFTAGDGDSPGSFDDNGDRREEVPRRNRRGQQARRAIWEAKFGENAKHIQAQREKEAAEQPRLRPGRYSRHQDDQQRPRIVGAPGQRTQQRLQVQPTQRAPAQPEGRRRWDSSSMDPSTGKKVNEDVAASMHPSWAAKRMAAAKASTGVAGGAFTGKKIVFD